MSQIGVWNFNGSTTVPTAIVSWLTATDPVSEIQCSGGLYLFLMNIEIDESQLNSDVFTATLSGTGDVNPPECTYHTRTHIHSHAAFVSTPAGDVGAGPRLIYKTPIQFWVSAKFDSGPITLTISHPSSVSLTAMRLGAVDLVEPIGLLLR